MIQLRGIYAGISRRTSPLTAPDANKCDWMGLKSRPRTGPVWVLFRSIKDSVGLVPSQIQSAVHVTDFEAHSAFATIFEGSQISKSPFSIPATRTPCDRAASGNPHAKRLNLRVA